MNSDNVTSFTYSDDNFEFSIKPELKSKFDDKLHLLWLEKMKNGYFRYQLEDLNTKYLPGSYNFVAQLNVKRAVERRKPQFISSIAMPFNPDIFHFGKVSENEVLFTLKPQHWENDMISDNAAERCNHTLIINVSPIEDCHSLLVPSIEKCLPQVLNINGLRLAAETMLISSDSSLRMGFNSLGAYASVNHLHFHLYYLRYTLYLEHVPVNHLIGDCYELVSFPAEGFAFQITNESEVLKVLRSIMKLIDFLIKKEIPHNVFMTKGKPFTRDSSFKTESALRIFIWAREAVYGSKDDITFNAAVCELAGHVIVKEANGFDTITEEYVAAVLKDACHTKFVNVKNEVETLFA